MARGGLGLDLGGAGRGFFASVLGSELGAISQAGKTRGVRDSAFQSGKAKSIVRSTNPGIPEHLGHLFRHRD